MFGEHPVIVGRRNFQPAAKLSVGDLIDFHGFYRFNALFVIHMQINLRIVGFQFQVVCVDEIIFLELMLAFNFHCHLLKGKTFFHFGIHSFLWAGLPRDLNTFCRNFRRKTVTFKDLYQTGPIKFLRKVGKMLSGNLRIAFCGTNITVFVER